MNKTTGSFGLLMCLLSPYLNAQGHDWFKEQSALTNAHQFLLERQLNDSFQSMVQVWQTAPEAHIERHLDDLLNKSLEMDCGRGLDNGSFPSWLDKLSLKRQTVQASGRFSYRIELNMVSNEEIKSVAMTKWPERSVFNDSDVTQLNSDDQQSQEFAYTVSRDLNQPLLRGLFKLTVQSQNDEVWEDWILLSQPDIKQTLRWQASDAWQLEKSGLLNRFCPLPVLKVALAGDVDGEYQQVWSQQYESKFPMQLDPPKSLSAERYLLEVSLTHKRWQGPISIEEQQVINKHYNLVVDE